MSAYVVSVITAAAIISLALTIYYKKGSDGGAVKGAFSVLLVYVTVLPLLGALRDFNIEDFKIQTEDYDFGNESAVAELTKEAYERGICLFISEEFSLNSEEIGVLAMGFDETEMRAEKLLVTLKGDAVYADFRAIRESLSENGLSRGEVKIEIG